MSNIFFITRSYPGIYDHGSGGALVRQAYVELLKENGFVVWIVMPNFGSSQLLRHEENRTILIPYEKNQFYYRSLQKLGIVEDYLDPWVEQSILYLKNIVRSNDIVFGTSGGSLATIKLASKLKSIVHCKSVVNLHDPILYTRANGVMIYPHNFIPHVNRDKFEKKFLANQDSIITSSQAYANILKKKYPELKNKITYNHFGYITKQKIAKKDYKNKNLHIVYGGNMGETQSPEILAKAGCDMDNIKITFVGDTIKNKNLLKFKDQVSLVDKMPYSQFQKFLINEADVGFVSLRGSLSKLCVPSKIFEYINLALPILGSLENEDAKSIIEDNGFGRVCIRNTSEIKKRILEFKSLAFRQKCLGNLIRHRDEWEMKVKIQEVVTLLKGLY